MAKLCLSLAILVLSVFTGASAPPPPTRGGECPELLELLENLLVASDSALATSASEWKLCRRRISAMASSARSIVTQEEKSDLLRAYRASGSHPPLSAEKARIVKLPREERRASLRPAAEILELFLEKEYPATRQRLIHFARSTSWTDR